MGSSGQLQSRIIVGDTEKSRRFARSFLFAVQMNLTGLNLISRCVTMSHKRRLGWSTDVPALWLLQVVGLHSRAITQCHVSSSKSSMEAGETPSVAASTQML